MHYIHRLVAWALRPVTCSGYFSHPHRKTQKAAAPRPIREQPLFERVRTYVTSERIIRTRRVLQDRPVECADKNIFGWV